MNRIDKKFKELKAADKRAFIAFITAGYPNLSVTEELVFEFSKRGVDIIELGVPFSDPMADGPIIQEASKTALENKVNLNDIFKLVKKARKELQIPICLMTYYNPVFCFGEKRFVEEAVSSGVDGVIVPDLPPEEALYLKKEAKKNNFDTIFFLAPTSALKHIKLVSRVSTGFIYYIALTGVTGPRESLPADFKKHLGLIKEWTQKPVCAGFGVSNAKQVREIFKIADGVIVGSAIVKKIKENIGNLYLVKNTGEFVSELKGDG